MAAIADDDLILYHYNDGLTAAQREDITRALASSPPLQARYAQLCRVLASAQHDVPMAADAALEQRVWAGFEQRLQAAARLPHAAPPSPPRIATQSSARARRRPRWHLAAAAASVFLILGAGFFAGRLSTPEDIDQHIALQPNAGIPANPLMATRVLDAYVAAHLRQTEGVLLTALNSDSAQLNAGNAELATALVESNRLYVQAARNAGNTRLADFLRQMEPVLIELANPPRGDGIEVREGVRDYVRESDLLFQVRATEGRLESRGNHRT